MTESRVTQSGLSVLRDGDAESVTTQSAALYLYDEVFFVPALLSQSAVSVLQDVASESLVTQSAALFLGGITPCVSRASQCWKITRNDGVVYTFTEHDSPVHFRGNEYTPCGSLSSSAYEVSGEIGDVGNVSLVGLLGVDGQAGIPSRDIDRGLLDGAEVEIWSISWDGSESPMPLLKGFIGTITKRDISYSIEIVTLSSWMNQEGILKTYTPDCRFTLGDSDCGVDLSPFTEAGEVTALLKNSVQTQAGRRQFVDSTRAEQNDWWANGTITWTSGLNAGYSSEVAASLDSGRISLWESMPNPISIGDQYTIVAGCDKRVQTCKDKFSNFLNFGGFPQIPGTDKILQTPDAKQ